MEENCKQSAKETEKNYLKGVPKAPVEPFNAFDTTGAIASLSLTVVELQKAIGGIQGGIQQLGMKLVELMQAHNVAAGAIEGLTQSHNAVATKLESLTCGDKTEDGTPCTQNGLTPPC